MEWPSEKCYGGPDDQEDSEVAYASVNGQLLRGGGGGGGGGNGNVPSFINFLAVHATTHELTLVLLKRAHGQCTLH